MERVVSINGRLLPENQGALPVLDRGLLYGYGLFETMAVFAGQAFLMDAHLARLYSSASRLGLEVPYKPGELTAMISKVAEANMVQEGYLRVTLTAGSQPPGPLLPGTVIIQARGGIPYTGEQYNRGLAAGFSSVRRNETSPLTGLKTLNYLDNLLAREDAGKKGWGEGLLLNTRGCLAEGTASNVFLVSGGRLITPDPASGILPGITRQVVIQLALDSGLEVAERPVNPVELEGAGEAFLTNSLMGVMPLTMVSGKPVGRGVPGPVTAMLAARYREHIELVHI